MRRYAIGSLLVGLALVLSTGSNLLAKSDSADNGAYTEKDKEFYLTESQVAFIRPGLNIEVIDVVIPDDLQLEVTYSLKDPGDLPLDIDGVFTPGPVDMRYMLTFIPQGEEQKVKLTEGFRDSGGTLVSLGNGVFSYKFGTVLGENYDPDATHTLALVGRRDLREFDLDRYVDNQLHNFVPSGAFDAVPRDVVTTATCNGRCHDPLAMHGGRYREVAVCTQCHNPGLFARDGSGVSKSFDVLIHQVHSGGDLVNPLEDFVDLHFPAEINDCEICHTGGVPTENFPLVATPNPVPVCDMSRFVATKLAWDFPEVAEIRIGSPDGPLFGRKKGADSKDTNKWVQNGTVFYVIDKATGDTIQKLPVTTTALGCLNNQAGTFRGAPGKQHTNWLDHPSRRVCGACHDDVDFASGEGHPGGVQQDDEKCGICHVPDSGVEFDRSVRGTHKPTYKSAQLPGILVEILDVTNTGPGDNPTVTFAFHSKKGQLNPRSMDFFRMTIAGPNDDFSFFAQEDIRSAVVKAGDNWSYTFAAPLPADAAGSYSAGFEVFKNIPLEVHGEETNIRHTGENYSFAFAVTDPVAVPRRRVVEDYKCEACHSNLALHGTIRHNPNYCVTCHQPDLIDIATPAESVHFKYMIHKIHRGADLENGYVVVRSRGTFDFSQVAFPGDLRNCEKCHVDDSYKLPLPDDLLPSITGKALWSPMLPTAAACLACHDSDDTASHAFSNTTIFGEACATCHGEGMTFAVEKVHAR